MTTLNATQSNESTQPTHEFRAARKQVWIYSAIGFLGLTTILVAQIAETGSHPPTTPLVIGLLMAVWAAMAKPVQVFDDRIELKAAPLAPRRVIEFADIAELDEPKANRLTIRRSWDEAGKGIRVPLHLLEQGDREELLDVLRERV